MTEDTLDLTTDEALLSSLAEHQVGEIKLEPFSLLRQVIATDLSDEGSSMFFNALVTVWVCTLSPEEALRAHRDVAKAKLRAFEWGEAQGFSLVNHEPLFKAYRRLTEELNASVRARVKPDPAGNGGEIPNAGGQPT